MCPELTALPRCTVVQLSGVTPLRPVDANAVEAVRRAAFVARGIAYPIYAPLLLPDGAAARMLRQQPGIVEAISQFGLVTKAVVTVGAWGPGLSTVYDALSEREREGYRRQGGCAEIAGHLLYAEGRIVAPQLSERIIAVSLEELRQVPDVILLADGAKRAAATSAALKTGLFNGIVTDAECGRAPAGVKPDESAEFVRRLRAVASSSSPAGFLHVHPLHYRR